MANICLMGASVVAPDGYSTVNIITIPQSRVTELGRFVAVKQSKTGASYRPGSPVRPVQTMMNNLAQKSAIVGLPIVIQGSKSAENNYTSQKNNARSSTI